MRHGEVLGLRGQDAAVDAGSSGRRRVQRIQGELHIGPVKTRARNRHLPLIGPAQDALSEPPVVEVIPRVPGGSTWWLS
jgi:hypothetical protein